MFFLFGCEISLVANSINSSHRGWGIQPLLPDRVRKGKSPCPRGKQPLQPMGEGTVLVLVVCNLFNWCKRGLVLLLVVNNPYNFWEREQSLFYWWTTSATGVRECRSPSHSGKHPLLLVWDRGRVLVLVACNPYNLWEREQFYSPCGKQPLQLV